jgi:hypothetical protein
MKDALALSLLMFLAVACGAQSIADPRVGAECNKDNRGTKATDCVETAPPLLTPHAEVIAKRSDRSTPEQQVLPDDPGATLQSGDPQVHFQWQLGIPMDEQVSRAPRLPIWDKKMWAAHMVLASSMIFDTEVTHEGVAHHRCEEGNSDLRKHPSRGELYVDNLLQFAPITVMDWLGAKAARNGHIGRWFWKSLGYMDPAWGSVVHFRGGVQWLTNCW